MTNKLELKFIFKGHHPDTLAEMPRITLQLHGKVDPGWFPIRLKSSLIFIFVKLSSNEVMTHKVTTHKPRESSLLFKTLACLEMVSI